MPVVSQIRAILDDGMKRRVKKSGLAMQLAAAPVGTGTRAYTPFAREKYRKHKLTSQKMKHVVVNHRSETDLRGIVSLSESHRETCVVMLNQEQEGNAGGVQMSSTCGRSRELGMPCPHVIALVREATRDQVGRALRCFWKIGERKWFHKAYWIRTYMNQMGTPWVAGVPETALVPSDQTECFPPPIQKRPLTDKRQEEREGSGSDLLGMPFWGCLIRERRRKWSAAISVATHVWDVGLWVIC